MLAFCFLLCAVVVVVGSSTSTAIDRLFILFYFILFSLSCRWTRDPLAFSCCLDAASQWRCSLGIIDAYLFRRITKFSFSSWALLDPLLSAVCCCHQFLLLLSTGIGSSSSSINRVVYSIRFAELEELQVSSSSCCNGSHYKDDDDDVTLLFFERGHLRWWFSLQTLQYHPHARWSIGLPTLMQLIYNFSFCLSVCVCVCVGTKYTHANQPTKERNGSHHYNSTPCLISRTWFHHAVPCCAVPCLIWCCAWTTGQSFQRSLVDSLFRHRN